MNFFSVWNFSYKKSFTSLAKVHSWFLFWSLCGFKLLSWYFFNFNFWHIDRYWFWMLFLSYFFAKCISALNICMESLGSLIIISENSDNLISLCLMCIRFFTFLIVVTKCQRLLNVIPLLCKPHFNFMKPLFVHLWRNGKKPFISIRF